ncbi:hypothetical protein [Thermococcus henrietii]|uniref:hypothetical protein n=1 Tax=Thermococcus henrietii TaxID=2016361 RepID=UPI0011AB4DEA|nr:hypothetical protein [Thermococcus henrietii]
MTSMDITLFMERYGYNVLLRLMTAFTFGFIGGIPLFFAHVATRLVGLLIVGYIGVEMVIRRLYRFISGEDPGSVGDNSTITAVQSERNKNFGKYL